MLVGGRGLLTQDSVVSSYDSPGVTGVYGRGVGFVA
jgi:hypothetical protein